MESPADYWNALCKLQKEEYEHLAHAEVQTKRRLAKFPEGNTWEKLHTAAQAMELGLEAMSRVTDDINAPANTEDLETLRCLSNSALSYCKRLSVAPVKHPRRSGIAKASRCTETVDPLPPMRKQLKRKSQVNRKSRTDEDVGLPVVQRATFPLVDLEFKVEVDYELEKKDVLREYGDAYCTLDLEDKDGAPVQVKLAPMINGCTNFKADCLQDFAPMMAAKITELMADNLEADNYKEGQRLRVICETSLGTMHVIERRVQ